ncbi:Gfo/Idh/MocA family protein [Nocardia sp. NPDC051570]|uniref:Gfo/Idh/MocA family protein n=1 Tax=Nocardia sp. NPDC051570 TaxID=3364324 RepID=UPI0037BD05FA
MHAVGHHADALKTAVVGLGHQATNSHLPCLALSPVARLAAVCDENPAVLRDHQHRLSVPSYADFHEMFESEDLDLVVVCVPHHVGREVIVAAAQHHIHVLKEKPFATTLEEATELAEICKKSGIHLMVSLQRRLDPIYTSFPLLADRIGKPFLIEGRYTMHVEDPSDGWRGLSAKAGGGCVIDMGYHLIDLILWYFGLPDEITADLSVGARPDRCYAAEDTALVHFSYDDGLYGSLLLSRFIGPKTEELGLIGSHGAVRMERSRIRRFTNGGNIIEAFVRKPTGSPAGADQIEYFARVLDGSRPNISSPDDHVAHLAFVTACYQAARTRATVRPKELL